MREIKFRAWNDIAKVMYPSDIPGLLIHFDGELNGLDENGMLEGTDNTRQHHLMQYTGLKDRNGKEIYEGDIISIPRWRNSKYQVVFESGMFRAKSMDEESKVSLATFKGEVSCEVIGNIYKHPHLLEGDSIENQ